jgi:ABC-type phosphate transport system auxiliary subunit
MTTTTNNKKPLWMAILLVLTLTLGAWQIGEAQSKKQKRVERSNDADTTFPSQQRKHKHEVSMAELDKAMKHLDEAMAKLHEEMGKLDFSKIEKDMENAFKEIDGNKLEAELNKALSEVDVEKIQEQVNQSLAKAKANLKKVDMEKLKAEMEQLKIEMKQHQFDSKKMHAQVEEGMKKAKAGIAKAKEEIKLMKEFINALHDDGLLDKNKPYTVEWKDGDLWINGTKQSDATKDKYKKYVAGKKDNFTIKSDGKADDDDEGEGDGIIR